jgi:hypothetical protein
VTWLLLLLVLLAALVLAVLMVKRRPEPQVVGCYRSKRPLSEPEQVLFWRLREALPECVVLSQVSFSRFIEPAGVGGSGRQALFNRISRKTVDFLLCLPDFTLVAAVELDDGSHLVQRDVKRDAILKDAGIPILRMNVRDIPSVDQLRSLITK